MKTQIQELESLFEEAQKDSFEGDHDNALRRFNQILQIVPNHPHVLRAAAISSFHLCRIDQGIEYLSRALRSDPNQPGIYCDLGVALLFKKENTQALFCFDRAIELDPTFYDAFINKSSLLHDIKRFEDSIAVSQKAVAIRPNSHLAYINLARSYNEIGKFQESVDVCDIALVLHPSSLDACLCQTIALAKMGKMTEAKEVCAKILASDPHHKEARLHLGNCLLQEEKFSQALDQYHHVLFIDPDYVAGLSNRGFCYLQQLDLDNAVKDFEKALSLQPDFMDAQWNLSLALLTKGDFKRGWKLYESRFQTKKAPATIRHLDIPWLGTLEVNKKKVFIHIEQGYGDVIQFCRYLPLLADLGAKVTIEVPNELQKLICSIDSRVNVVLPNTPIGSQDRQVPLLTLPYLFDTEEFSIPSKTPYLWIKKALKKTKASDRIQIGFAFSGEVKNPLNLRRRIPLNLWKNLLECPFEFHCLHKEITTEEKEFLQSYPSVHIHQEAIKDFTDTAALILEMDLIITVDTSIAHLTGALGKPVWILLSHTPDFRWMLHRKDSPWYPTAELIRQEAMGDWNGVMQTVEKKLKSSFLTKGRGKNAASKRRVG